MREKPGEAYAFIDAGAPTCRWACKTLNPVLPPHARSGTTASLPSDCKLRRDNRRSAHFPAGRQNYEGARNYAQEIRDLLQVYVVVAEWGHPAVLQTFLGVRVFGETQGSFAPDCWPTVDRGNIDEGDGETGQCGTRGAIAAPPPGSSIAAQSGSFTDSPGVALGASQYLKPR